MRLKKPSKSRYFLIYITLTFIIVSLLSALTPFFKLDLQISEQIQKINIKSVTLFMETVSYLGNYPTMLLVVTVTTIWMFFKGLKTEAVIGSLSAAGSALSGMLLKVLAGRSRPDSDLINVRVWLSDNSYPSNHVLVFTVFFGFLIYVVEEKIKSPITRAVTIFILLSIIISIGLSRIYLGVHWASDVLGGYLLGLIWLVFIIKLYNSRNGQR